ncbi:MAG: hypothetical protein JXQ99_23605 [Hyphomicrobiaceae bacterium]
MEGGWLALVFGVIFPQDADGIKVFYLVVMVICVAINILWDFLSQYTPPFSIDRIGEKVPILFSSSTIASSLLLIFAVFDDGLTKALGEFWLPFLLAGGAGLMVSLKDLSPVQAYSNAVQSLARQDMHADD